MIKILRTTSENQDFRNLVRLLDQDLTARYEAAQAEYDKHNKIENNNTVVVAYLDNEAVGCGCMKAFNDKTIEIKRMFVKPEHRSKGVAYSILRELEQWAVEKSYTISVLETGNKQPEAIGLYKKLGYTITENYGPYIGMELSICMSKKLNQVRHTNYEVRG